ncbi:MAG: hypothetical protein JO066_08620 [Verrucomicrobia bacterium]|nr:hypothetical protein [Verrucomicrobiota bacterium]
MRSVIPAVGMIAFLIEVAAGQQPQPSPATPLVLPKIEEAPVPSGAPEPQAAPDLLPESNQLPGEPPDLRLPSPSTLKPGGTNSTQLSEVEKVVSPEEQEKNRARLVALRALVMRSPRLTDLLKEANGAMMVEAKREFMRAYYHTLCTRMRQLDPRLGQTITAFEREEIRKLATGPSRLAIVSRDFLHRERPRHGRRPD